jgi:hypothetical protein
MVTATIIRGFSYDEVTASPMYMVRLGLATLEGERKRIKYRRGQKKTFVTWQEYQEFEELATMYGGEVEWHA